MSPLARTPLDAIVVGAGIAGLARARALHAQGKTFRVLEARPVAGGCLETITTGDGFRFEAGPEAVLDRDGSVAAFLDEIGVGWQPAGASGNPKRWIVHKGRLVTAPLGPRALLTTPLLSMRGKARFLRERGRDPAAALDGSVAEFAEHRFGPEALNSLVDPMIRGIHAGDPATLSLRACFPELPTLLEKHGSLLAAMKSRPTGPGLIIPRNGGMSAVVDALVAGLEGRVETGAPVLEIERQTQGFAVTCVNADGRHRMVAREVVVATPAAAAARVLTDAAHGAAHALATQDSVTLTVLAHAWPRSAVAHPLDGFGYVTPSSGGLTHLGTSFSTTIGSAETPDGLVMLRTMARGTPDDDELLAEVAPLIGLGGEPAWTHTVRHGLGLPVYDLDQPTRAAAIRDALPPGLSVIGQALDGVGVPSSLAAGLAAAV